MANLQETFTSYRVDGGTIFTMCRRCRPDSGWFEELERLGRLEQVENPAVVYCGACGAEPDTVAKEG